MRSSLIDRGTETINLAQLKIKKGRHCNPANNSPFTGIAVGSYYSYKNPFDLSWIKCCITYIDGKRNGLTEWFDKDGYLRYRARYKCGKYHGFFCGFHRDGHVREKGYYKNSKKEGLWKWFDIENRLRMSKDYKNGKRHGLMEIFYKNGQLASTDNYKNGKQEGLREGFDADGILSYRQLYKNGEKDGLSKYYYENGQLELETNRDHKPNIIDVMCEIGDLSDFFGNTINEEGNLTRSEPRRMGK